jgi:hypothetical protein
MYNLAFPEQLIVFLNEFCLLKATRFLFGYRCHLGKRDTTTAEVGCAQ